MSSCHNISVIYIRLTFVELEKMYYTLHEADVSKFAGIADARIREHFAETNLKRIRTAYGCSQAELAKKSGVGLRSIQLYEQRQIVSILDFEIEQFIIAFFPYYE